MQLSIGRRWTPWSGPIRVGLVLACVALLGGMACAPAWASKEPAAEAERYRLEQEMDRLAQRVTWPGVERTYAAMIELQVPISTHSHYTAALAAEARGDMLESWIRLERALREKGALEVPEAAEGSISALKILPESVDESEPSAAAARAAFEQLRSRYGRVHLTVEKGRLPALVRRGENPFSATEREAIRRGREKLVSTNTYVGLLPIGAYMIDGEGFEVRAGESVVVHVAKP